MPSIEAIAERAAAADGASPLDEATTMALRDNQLRAVKRDGAFYLVRGTELTLVVDPPARRHGLGLSLLTDALEAHPQLDRAWSHGNHPGAQALATHVGWRRTRDLWVMRRPVGEDAEPLPPLEVPDDVKLHAFGERSGDSYEVLRVNHHAFADHPEQGSMDLVDMARRMAEPWFDPAGLIIAAPTTGRGTLGFHWTKKHSATLGEVYVVGVAPEAQGRGIGRLVTLAGLHHLADSGVTEVILYVEADNTAAVRTYSKLGFTHADVDTHVMYTRD
ncbi:mycothiol synthase [Nocardioides daphniae]|uniref:Mycothiol acetyltransferase n=1 Tax=Nocardioides daphniae TaxID=402297 RepID=A0A4P7UAT6_9ACTN|nr:mycothiol synthase [Nocardioides daphniae]QCC76378.1 mycothiol synthase [Nocardioides daphniae]GGD07411.1 mycothiol acetyltransferase [Nocardioides daphniae]